MDFVEDVGQRCVFCLNDTSPGSGRYVNRIPASHNPADLPGACRSTTTHSIPSARSIRAQFATGSASNRNCVAMKPSRPFALI